MYIKILTGENIDIEGKKQENNEYAENFFTEETIYRKNLQHNRVFSCSSYYYYLCFLVLPFVNLFAITDLNLSTRYGREQ